MAPSRTVGANKATGKEMPAEESKRDQMMGPGKTLWETRNFDTALRNPMQAFRFSTANVGTLVGGGCWGCGCCGMVGVLEWWVSWLRRSWFDGSRELGGG